jgi:hypothetical protein
VRLVVRDGSTRRELLLEGTVVVGRDPSCDVSGSEPRLSRRHAEFQLTPHGVLVRDLQSRNGIRVNGQSVGEARLRPGDVVHIAHLAIQLVQDDDVDPPGRVAPPAATSETPALGVSAAPFLDERARVAFSSGSPPAATAAVVLDDRTRVMRTPPGGRATAAAPVAHGFGPLPTTVSAPLDPGEVVIREGLTGSAPPWQLGLAATLGVGTLARAGWGRHVLGQGVLLALVIQCMTLLPVIVWESRAFGATVARAWYVLLPAIAASVLAGLLGSALIARLTAGALATPGEEHRPRGR